MEQTVERFFSAFEGIRFFCNSLVLRVTAIASKYTAVQHVIFAAYLSISVGIIETFLSFLVAIGDGSDGVLSITILGFAEILGGILVLYRWAMLSQATLRIDTEKREVYCSMLIAVVLVLLGSTFFQTAFLNLIFHAPKTKLMEGIWVALFGTLTGLALYKYKMFYGSQIGSIVVITDAKCSQCSAFVSLSVLIILILQQLFWWADSLVGILLAVYIIYDGYQNFQVAYDKWKQISLDQSDVTFSQGVVESLSLKTEPLLNSRDEENSIHQNADSIVF